MSNLQRVPFLQNIPVRALKAAEKESVWFSIPGGGTLFDEGSSSDAIYFLLSGTLGAFRRASDGRMEFIGHIRPGEPVGEMAMLAEINDAPGLMRYAREKIGEKSRICFEAEPKGDRSIKSLNLPILEMICEARATNDDCVDLDDLFGPIPERIAA